MSIADLGEQRAGQRICSMKVLAAPWGLLAKPSSSDLNVCSLSEGKIMGVLRHARTWSRLKSRRFPNSVSSIVKLACYDNPMTDFIIAQRLNPHFHHCVHLS